MLKKIATACATLLLASSTIGLNTYTANASTFIYALGDYKVLYVSDGVELYKYIGTDTDVIVPDVLEGYTVKSYNYRLFQNNESVKSIKLNDTVGIVPDNMLSGTKSLESVEYGINTTYIGSFNNGSIKVLDASNVQTDAVFATDGYSGIPIERLRISASVDIPDDINYNYAITSVELIGNSKYLELGEDNGLYDKDNGKLILYVKEEDDKSVFVLGNGNANRIAKLNGTSISTIIFTDNELTEIPTGFSKLSQSTTFMLPDSVTSIGAESLGYTRRFNSLGQEVMELKEDAVIIGDIQAPSNCIQKYCFDNHIGFFPKYNVESSVFDRYTKNEVNSNDALSILQQVCGLTKEDGTIRGLGDDFDIDRSGFIESSDALAVLQSVVGLGETSPNFYGFDESYLEYYNEPLV